MSTRPALSALLALTFAAFAAPATADCRRDVFEGVPFSVCTADPASDDLRLFLTDPDGAILGSFQRVRDTLADEGADLGFAMNAGMFHTDRSPVGHYLDPRGEARGVITSAGPGNFGMLPNGVFCIGDGWAQVIESRAYAADRPDCRFATQSGPMLVIDGTLHPRFIEGGSSRYVRNGVGVTADGTVVAAISDRPVNFHTFARFFRDQMGTPNALYLDGNVSRLYAPALGRNDVGLPMGPIIGLVVPAD
ncbi:phosphodiester glycosidase family protein [Palleronia sp. KMU-117]|uniref:phosphodiester glycosidase family protein n=1 Tax=Palleronia sp. KMU-117 TaxID=3434108 RepID=UPI003D71C477